MSASTAIPARCALGDDALQPEFGGVLKELGVVTLKIGTQLDWGARVRLDQLPERCPPLEERRSPRNLAIQMQEIEGKEHNLRCGAQAVADDRNARNR
jgi:hypothetical protein